ncbi:nucleotide exchange factor GrpE [Anabaena sphaerica FACHB-251]|uniref:Nucleotide exchange factor GrpE n=1 Tax=Anabaena sphaerica FACHB-251 TaxID=2692883 RepID=A0A926WJQ8_9NOST|nr:nucleotide exchange factor GrpE [Anabaena sphaerica]MBD2295435.1 nucleotide exchange factor GrpE [Anabaena sphaerica FACHB-251]
MPEEDFTPKLRNLMQSVGISSFKTLSSATGVSEWQILCLRRGKLEQMRVEVLLKLSKVLQISPCELIATFSTGSSDSQVLSFAVKTEHLNTNAKLLQEIADLRREYERIMLTLEQQRDVLQQEFRQSSLQILESLLLFWPTVAQKAKDNPHLEAVKILPLVQKPLEKLLQAWGVEAIASVGAEIPYNPEYHELLQGTAQLGETVKVCYIGYRQADKLLYRAKVNRL